MLFLLMLAGLVLSTSIPEAFGPRGLGFTFAYVLMPIGRSLFDLRALKGVNHANYRNFQRVTTGSPCRRSSGSLEVFRRRRSLRPVPSLPGAQ
jgi:Bacterial low temperature requirement A protein (LtrA)